MYGTVREIIENLQKYEDKDQVVLMPLWGIDDVLSLEVGKSATKEQASRALLLAGRSHDAEQGINWSVLENAIETVMSEDAKEEKA